jgi:hypothetical protein
MIKKTKIRNRETPSLARVESLVSLEPDPVTDEVVLHQGLTLIEVADPADLSSLMVDSRIKPYIVAKLSETQLVVLPQHTKMLIEALRKAGHTPKVSQGASHG